MVKIHIMADSLRVVQLTLDDNKNSMLLRRCTLNQFNQLRVVHSKIPSQILDLYHRWLDNTAAPVVNKNQIIELCKLVFQFYSPLI